MDTAFIGNNVRRIRENLEWTQLKAAEQAGISLPTYSGIELSKRVPKMDTLYKIAAALGVGIQDLLAPVRQLSKVRFRAQKKMKKRSHVLARASQWLDDFNFLLDMNRSEVVYKFSNIPSQLEGIPEESKPREAAQIARQLANLDQQEPIHDITGLFAANGIKVLAHSLKSEGFFGMSIGESDGGPAIVINVWDRIRVERWIFSAAHELGHLILHLSAFNVEVTKENIDQEKQADSFASYFLMPQEGFDKEWEETYGLSMWDRILKIKRIYHVSYKTVIYRLIEMGILNRQDVWIRVNSFLRKRYGKSKIPRNYEPEELQRYDFVTDWLDRLVRVAYDKDQISMSRASEILNISIHDMRNRVNPWVGEQDAIH